MIRPGAGGTRSQGCSTSGKFAICRVGGGCYEFGHASILPQTSDMDPEVNYRGVPGRAEGLTRRSVYRVGNWVCGIATLGSMSGHTSDLALVNVAPVRKRVWTYVFNRNPEFVKPWWRPEQDPSDSCRWASICQGINEVARCKYVLKDDPDHGEVVDILGIEVAVPLRRQGIGRRTLDLIREANPGRLLIALNDDAVSRGFWERVGWVRDELSEFSRFTGVERVTYVEPL